MTRKRLYLHMLWALPVVLGTVAAWPQIAAAYVENTVAARQASPYGCIQQTGGLLHSGASVTIKATAFTSGVTAANPTFCNNITTPGIFKLISGNLTATLIKLTKTRSGQTDLVTICTAVGTGQKPLGAKLELNQAIPQGPNGTGPCGDGYYAQIICLQNATAVLTDGTSAIGGAYNATALAQCNISPNWHPVNLGTEVIGPPVKL
jgi:hypothetical protein